MMTGMRFDWNLYGKPGIARVNRFGGWAVTALAAVTWPLYSWLALTWGWTMILVPLLLTAFAVFQRVMLRKTYGVRQVRVIDRPKPLAEALAEQVEAIRQRQWDQVTELAWRARPPDPKRLATAADAGTLPVPPAVRGPLRRSIILPSGSYPVASREDLDRARRTANLALGFARLGAALGGCAHANAEPVDLLVTGERVAWICPDCPAELPAGWR